MKKCKICGVTEETNRIIKLRNKNEYYCSKHRSQLKRYSRITDKNKPLPYDETFCEVCGVSSLETKIYQSKKHEMTLCRRHSIQMSRHGKILEHTIYEKNEIILHNGYIEIITKDVKGNLTGSTYIDEEDYDKIKDKYKDVVEMEDG